MEEGSWHIVSSPKEFAVDSEIASKTHGIINKNMQQCILEGEHAY